MNRIIIIGNGFDLAHGLKTSYADFALDHIQKAYHGEFRHNANEMIKFNSNEPTDFLKNLESISQLEDLKNKGLRITLLNRIFGNMLSAGNRVRWVDIEMNYFQLLSKIATNSNYSESQNLTPKGFDYVQKINDEFESIKSHFIDFVKRQSAIPNFVLMDECIHIFKRELKHDQPGKYPDKTVFINFNYTKTVEAYLHELNKDTFKNNQPKFECFNIHGQIDDISNPPIFGFGDEVSHVYQDLENLNENEVLKFSKSFGYFVSGLYKKLSSLVNNPKKYEVYVIGHSCGLSDRTLLKEVFEHDNCTSITIFHHANLPNYVQSTQEISRHFTDKNKMRLRVVDFNPQNICPQLTDSISQITIPSFSVKS